ncbi:hypothetical protein AK812_SmicGene10838 [Symbiodinium microadriaticum]|uniref:Uncharacterized protein n=1 Tax=Symbiodinium microadriaticum TaxID=2951 RepID=A0A1Q9EEP7_SYMMI|nr:hypothetical protein AK812_SmicGene10838 [Symbiodinium microadriaticum]
MDGWMDGRMEVVVVVVVVVGYFRKITTDVFGGGGGGGGGGCGWRQWAMMLTNMGAVMNLMFFATITHRIVVVVVVVVVVVDCHHRNLGKTAGGGGGGGGGGEITPYCKSCGEESANSAYWPQDGIGIWKALRVVVVVVVVVEMKLNKILKRQSGGGGGGGGGCYLAPQKTGGVMMKVVVVVVVVVEIISCGHVVVCGGGGGGGGGGLGLIDVGSLHTDQKYRFPGSPMMSRLEENVSFAPDITATRKVHCVYMHETVAANKLQVIAVPFAKPLGSNMLLPRWGTDLREKTDKNNVLSHREAAVGAVLNFPRDGSSIYASVDAVTWTEQLKADWKSPAASWLQQLVPLAASSFRGIAPSDNLALRVPEADAEAPPAEAWDSHVLAQIDRKDRDGRDEAQNLPGALNTPSVSKAGTILSIGGAGEKKKSSTVMYHEPAFLNPEPAEIHHDYGSSILMLGLLILEWLQGAVFFPAEKLQAPDWHALQTDELTLALGKLHLLLDMQHCFDG